MSTPADLGRTTTVTVTVLLGFNVPSAQWTILPPVHVPELDAVDTNVVAAGSGSSSTTPVAVSGPLFRTTIVYVSRPPIAAGSGRSVFVTARSICGGDGGGGGVTTTAAGSGSGFTVTGAVSVEVTSGPTGGCPVAVAVFVNAAVTLASVQV